MREDAVMMCSDDYATETIDDIGEVTSEERVYYEKVGQEEEKVAVGTEKVKVGTRKKKVGSRRIKVGTKSVKNPKKKWWKIFTPKYIERNVYETVDDYENEDVYETVVKYETVMKDIYEEHTETIEKFTVETAVIQSGLIAKLRKNLDEGIDKALTYADEMINEMKNQFTVMFDELDILIEEKYTELEMCISDQKTKEEELKKNKELLKWIEDCNTKIEDVLNI